MLEIDQMAKQLAALGHASRLSIFRLLVQAGGEGLSVGTIMAHSAIPASTLAHHVSALVDAGLVIQERQGRHIINRVDYAAAEQLLSYLTHECCAGISSDRDDVA